MFECSGRTDWATVVEANRQQGRRLGNAEDRGDSEDYSTKRLAIEDQYGCMARYSPWLQWPRRGGMVEVDDREGGGL